MCKSKSSLLKSSSGSVIMEFILVAPLYLMLLGGMFQIGSFILNTYKIATYDVYASLGYNSTLAGNSDIKNSFDYLFALEGDFSRTSNVFLSEEDSEDNILANCFLVQQSSGTQVSFTGTSFLWQSIYGMLYSLNLFRDDKVTETTDYDISTDYQRQFVIKVRESQLTTSGTSSSASYDRTKSAENLSLNYIWYNVSYDDFPFVSSVQSSYETTSVSSNEYNRDEFLMSVAE